MNILDKIIAYKKEEVAQTKASQSVATLEGSPLFERNTVSASEWVRNPEKSGIIAEIKRKSPSKGMINAGVSIEATARGYDQAGASAISILTDREFFGGRNGFLTRGKQVVECPILRKDFIIDEYQILEAKAIGADMILLIAAVLAPSELASLAAFAKSLGLEVLMEVHNEEELRNNLYEHLDLVGVNNRNLKNFEVSIETSIELSELIPDEFVKISESGISDPNNILKLKNYGYQGFLIGENFMKERNPSLACKQFIEELEKLEVGV